MTNDDNDWLEAVQGVKPIKKAKKLNKKPVKKEKLTQTSVDDWDDFLFPVSEKRQNLPQKQEYEPEEILEEYQKPEKEQPFKIHSNIASKISASRASLDAKTMKKLAQGKISPESKIDLHGFYLDDAWGALMDFINKSAINGCRCVLVVHGKGKGYGAKKDMGIIKSQVNGWLLGHPKILAYHTAAIQHGGNGALYILLKKNN